MPKPKVRPELNYRTLPLNLRAEDGTPSTLDEKTRSVEVIGATENPVDEFDWERWETIPTILRMDGFVMPDSRQLVLLDTHSRWSTSNVIGSYRNMQVENGQLVGRAHFSSVEEAEKPYTKVREGHLTDFSIARRTLESTYIKEGENGIVGGRTYEGPVRVVTKWQPRELSVCPVGADELAKVRAEMRPENLPPNNKEDGTMPKPTVQELTRSAPAVEATQTTTPTQPVNTPNAEEIRAEGTQAEHTRQLEINALADRTGLPDDKRKELIADVSKTVADAQRAALDHLTATSPQVGHRVSIEVTGDAQEKFRSAAQDSLILRAGMLIENPAPGASDLRGYSLRELSRECLRVRNLPFGGDSMQIVGRALTGSDLPAILGNIANLSVMAGWEEASETWQEWCGTGQVSNFQVHTAARAGETDDLDEIKEDAEYKYGKLVDRKEQYQVATYGKLLLLSRQAIINDDLGQLTDIPRKHGEAAARKVGDIAYAVLIANATMGDGNALFDGTNHGNVGTGGVLSENTIAEGIKLMKLQKDINGKRRLNIPAKFVIAPVALEGSFEIFFNSGQFSGTGIASTRNNPYAGTRFTRVFDARLDDDNAARYYFAGPKGKTVIVFFLNGNQTPYLETRQGWNVDGVEYKVRIDAGAKAMDWRGLVRNAGA